MNLNQALCQPIALYVHIPFCLHLCPYCAFYKIKSQSDMIEVYLNAIELECRTYKEKGGAIQIHSVFLGGGTPNALAPSQLDRLLNCIADTFHSKSPDIERTSELNPEAVTADIMDVYIAHGFNRFSLGVQSFQPKILDFLGRRHTPEHVVQAMSMIQKRGICNINIDLIFSTPISRIRDIQEDLNQALALEPMHLSTYALTIEDDTPFFKRGVQGLTDDCELTHYDVIQDKLVQEGFEHYEVSAFAKPGYRSVHNMSYWQLTPYIGIGPSASSYLHRHYQNPSSLSIYNKNPTRAFHEALQAEPDHIDQKKNDFWLTNLRLLEGVSKSRYQDRFGVDPSIEHGPALQNLKKKGWLVEEEDVIRVTKEGLALLNTLLVELIA